MNLDKDYCPLGYPLCPHVVWFGEDVPAYKEAMTVVQQTDIFIVIGSSLNIYPVADLLHEITAHCEAHYIDPQADGSLVPKQYQCLNMTASEDMRQLFQQWINV